MADAPETPKPQAPTAEPTAPKTKTDGPTQETKAKAARKTTARTPRPRRKPAARKPAPVSKRPLTVVAAAPKPDQKSTTPEPSPVGAAALTLADGLAAGGERVAVLQTRIADATQLPWLASLIRANADFTREIARAYARTSRALLQPK